MKKILTILTIPLFVMAQSFLISNIQLPQTHIQNLDPYPCDKECLQEFIDNEQFFSFLAHADSILEDIDIEQIRREQLSKLGMKPMFSNAKLKIALLLPYKKIGRYASSTMNASFAYLISKNRPFELKSYNINHESVEELTKILQQIQDDGFGYVIAPLTQMGETIVSEINPEINIFFPTINKKDSSSQSLYLLYGGIDYRAQSDMLLKESSSPLVIFYDKSAIGKKLSLYQEGEFKKYHNTNEILLEQKGELINKEKSVIKFQIPRRTTNLEKQLKDNEDIVDGSFFVNTPIIKSGMIISQLTLYDTNATNVLSTQTNYNPLLLSMTQYQDRKHMIIANSITQHKDVIIETNSLLGNDIVYDWINYTTTIGVDYFFSKLRGEKRDYNEIKIIDNQMIYDIQLIQPSVSRFIPYLSSK